MTDGPCPIPFIRASGAGRSVTGAARGSGLPLQRDGTKSGHHIRFASHPGFAIRALLLPVPVHRPEATADQEESCSGRP
jgi:hypothetical protein